MILTAQDIQSQQFHVRFRGFDVEEVDDFLEKIATAFQTVSEENHKLKDRLESLIDHGTDSVRYYRQCRGCLAECELSGVGVLPEVKDFEVV